MGFHFLGSRGKVGSAGLVALVELVHKGPCEEPVFPERWNDALYGRPDFLMGEDHVQSNAHHLCWLFQQDIEPHV
jgi:hypothetical protein